MIETHKAVQIIQDATHVLYDSLDSIETAFFRIGRLEGPDDTKAVRALVYLRAEWDRQSEKNHFSDRKDTIPLTRQTVRDLVVIALRLLQNTLIEEHWSDGDYPDATREHIRNLGMQQMTNVYGDGEDCQDNTEEERLHNEFGPEFARAVTPSTLIVLANPARRGSHQGIGGQCGGWGSEPVPPKGR